jgi:hypothetical protein
MNDGAAIVSSFALKRWDNTGVTNTNFKSAGTGALAGTVTITVTQPGYYAVYCQTRYGEDQNELDELHLGMSITTPALAPVLAHRTIPAFGVNYSSLDSARINAISMLYTNTANPLYRGGSVYSMQAPLGVYWYHYVDGTNILADALGVDFRTSENGSYGFLKSTQPNDRDMHVHHQVTGAGALADVYYPLATQCDYLVTQVTSATAENATQTWTWNMVLEFTTVNIFFETKEADGSIDDYQKAMEMVKRLDQWKENKTHWKVIQRELGNAAKSVFKFGQKYGPTALKMAKMVAPLMA